MVEGNNYTRIGGYKILLNADVPMFSADSESIFNKYISSGDRQQAEVISVEKSHSLNVKTLKESIAELKVLIEERDNAKKHSLRNKVICFLKVALVTTLAAASIFCVSASLFGIFGLASLPLSEMAVFLFICMTLVGAIGIPFVFSALSVCNYQNAQAAFFSYKAKIFATVAATLFAPLSVGIPFVELFTKIPVLEKKVEEQKKRVAKKIEGYEKILTPELKAKIEEKIDCFKAGIKAALKCNQCTDADGISYDQHVKALNDFNIFKKFFDTTVVPLRN